MAGDTLDLTVQHPTAGSRTFAVQSDQSITVDVGGRTKTIQMNGNGTGHPKSAVKPWEIAGLMLEYDPENGDQEFLQGLVDTNEPGVVTWQHTNGYIYKGSGSIEGDIKADSNTGYIPVTFTGPGKLEKI